MWLVNGRPDVAKTALFWSLWRVWGQWDWRSTLSGHTRRQEASLSRRFTGGCSAPLFLCWGTPLGPERGRREEEARRTLALLWFTPGLPWTLGWKSDPHARAASAPVSSLCTARSASGMDQEETAEQQGPHGHCGSCSHPSATHGPAPTFSTVHQAISTKGQVTGRCLTQDIIIATQKCPCLCGPDKSLLAIKIVTHCKQQKLLTMITKNYQQTECQFPSWPVRGIFCRVLHSSDPIQETSPSWAVNQKLVLFWEKKL